MKFNPYFSFSTFAIPALTFAWANGAKAQQTGVVVLPDLRGTPAQLQKSIEQAYKQGVKEIRIFPGVYRMGESSNHSSLFFSNLSDCQIDVRGVTIVSTDVRTHVIYFDHCRHVTLLGGTFMHDPMPFSQGRIEAIGSDDLTFDIRIPKGYPTNVDNPAFFGAAPRILGFFDPTTRDWIRNANDIWFGQVNRLQNDLFRFHLKQAPPPQLSRSGRYAGSLARL